MVELARLCEFFRIPRVGIPQCLLLCSRCSQSQIKEHHMQPGIKRVGRIRWQSGRHILTWVLLGLIAVQFLVACGTAPLSNTTPTPAPTNEVAPTTIPTATAVAKPQADWKDSVVRIVIAGNFTDPTIGSGVQYAGGSGVIISEDGLVVTNNHVVGGASLVRIFIPGENQPRTGQVVAISECSDLALVQIDDEGSFQPLSWYGGAIETELAVRKAGYPGNSESVNVQEGIISQVGVPFNIERVSIERAIAHSAKLLAGDSGSVLVAQEDDIWKIVAINFGGNNANDQNYAVGRDEVKAFVERATAKLSETQVVLDGAIGINAVAVKGTFGERAVSGTWVRAVIAGSPAEAVGLKAGDLIMEMGGLPLAQDETLQVYCEFVRSRATAPLNIKVLRPATGEILEGQINTAGRELSVIETWEEGSAAPPTASNTNELVILTDFSPEQAARWRFEHDALVKQYQVRLFETFDRGLETRRAWPAGDSNGQLRNNRYEITLTTATTSVGETWNGANAVFADNYTIEVQVRFPTLTPYAEAGIDFDIQQADNQRFSYTMSNTGTWQIYLNQHLIATGKTPTRYAINADTDYGLWVTRSSDTVAFFFNGEIVAALGNIPNEGGQVGVVGIAGETVPAMVVVDTLVVRAP
jgi:S1-C subfamily serine protease